MTPQLSYAFAAEDDIGDLGRMIAHSFPGPTRTIAWWQEQLRNPVFGGGAETLLVGSERGLPAAACQLHALKQWVGGESLRCAGVGTVAVSPAYRRRGIGAELVTAALRAARDRGDIVSALYPFRVAFYRRLGYGQAGEALQYRVAPETLPDSPERLRVGLLDGTGETADAFRLYQRWARTQNGQLERSARLWIGVVGAPDTALAGYRAEDGSLEGYAFVVYRAGDSSPDRYLDVEELVWTTPRARRGLYAWLASLGDQWSELVIRALPSHRLGDWIREPRLPRGSAPVWRLWAPAATLLQGTMFRLLDARACWQRRRVQPGAPLRVRIELADDQLEDNSGSFRLVLEDENIVVDDGGDADLTLRTDVSTLSRLYIASLTPTGALGAGLLDCDMPDRLAALDAAFALPEPWTFDRF
jgi:predicted acetyltransferase